MLRHLDWKFILMTDKETGRKMLFDIINEGCYKLDLLQTTTKNAMFIKP